MADNLFSPECVRLLEAVFFASVGSAAVRGAATQEENPLNVFRTFYLDLSSSFLVIAFLRSSGLAASIDLSFMAIPSGPWSSRRDLLLPIAVALLLVAILAARARWSRTGHRRWADAAATVLVIAVAAFTASRAVPSATTQERFDALTRGVLSSYCQTDSTRDEATSLATISQLLGGDRAAPSTTVPQSLSSSAATADSIRQRPAGKWQRQHDRRMRRAALRGNPRDEAFCQTLRVYAVLRQPS